MLLVNETRQRELWSRGGVQIKDTQEGKRVSHSEGPISAICTPEQTAEAGLRETHGQPTKTKSDKRSHSHTV